VCVSGEPASEGDDETDTANAKVALNNDRVFIEIMALLPPE